MSVLEVRNNWASLEWYANGEPISPSDIVAVVLDDETTVDVRASSRTETYLDGGGAQDVTSLDIVVDTEVYGHRVTVSFNEHPDLLARVSEIVTNNKFGDNDSSLFEMVKAAGDLINDDRTIFDIHEHFISEVEELRQEMTNVYQEKPEGDDGVVGEAVDGILCLVDLIQTHVPGITEEAFNAVVTKKLKKWVRLYR